MKPIEDIERDVEVGVAEIFRRYGQKYKEENSMTKKQHEVMYAIARCRTSHFGYHVAKCDECDHAEDKYNSCRDRHCPKCQGIARKKWVDSRMSHLLPVPYYHVVFTLPRQLHPMINFNKEQMYDLLFSKAAETLVAFGRDPKWLGGELGFFGVLHTWGQTLWQHPHVHFIVAGGALAQDGRWISPRYSGKFLFPVKALSKVFRGKFIEGLKKTYYAEQLAIPPSCDNLQEPGQFERWVDHIVGRNWIVYCKSPFKAAEQVVRYIGRYTHRVAISNQRIDKIQDGKVGFWYKDYKSQSVTRKFMRLDAQEFIRRFMGHVLPHRFHKIRHYGFLANGRCKAAVSQIREILGKTVSSEDSSDKSMRYECPRCKSGSLYTLLIRDGFGRIVAYCGERLAPNYEFDTS